MPSSTPSWQSTLIALALVALAGGIFITVFEKEGTNSALEVWAAIGTIVGVLAGAIPTYFFSQQTTTAAKEGTEAAQETAAATRKDLEHARSTVAEERASRERVEKQLRIVLGVANEKAIERAKEIDPNILSRG